MKQRMVAGYNLKNSGIVAPNEPIKTAVEIPSNSLIRGIEIDPSGNFVLFAEVWSHPEGTEVAFETHEFVVVQPKQPLPPGSWNYFCSCVAMPLIFFVFVKGGLEIAT